MSDLPIQIVDENDRPVRAGTKEEAWQKGLLHRIVRIMAEDKEGNILLQVRDATKPTFPGCWDNSAAGHVDAGESYEEAALRELSEEIGIAHYKIEEVAYYPTHGVFQEKKLNRFNKLYKVVVPHDIHTHLQSDEVVRVKWFTPTEFRELVQKRPQKISDGLAEAYVQCYQ